MNCPPQFTADAVALYESRPEARIRQVAEPPIPGRFARLVGSAVTTFHERFCAATVDRLSAATRSRLDILVAEDGGVEDSAGGGVTFFSELKAEPGALRLDSLLTEVNKLQRVRAQELAPKLFGDVSEKLVTAWRARAAKDDLGPAGGSRTGAVHAAGCAPGTVSFSSEAVRRLTSRDAGEWTTGLPRRAGSSTLSTWGCLRDGGRRRAPGGAMPVGRPGGRGRRAGSQGGTAGAGRVVGRARSLAKVCLGSRVPLASSGSAPTIG
ncbi:MULTISPECIES: hypothetical protein [unclassified Streptomyces]|uniref:hypothetical protein n=1 Tax=unclassified Streptomyces TaxID=2593676 RepID=UPI0013012460|nr:hypothetical protein [Streptomyces sp. TSRI0281]